MLNNFKSYCVILVAVFFINSLSLHGAEEMPKAYKQGGMPYDQLWDEEDVKRYLDLPYEAVKDGTGHIKIDEAFDRIRELKRIGDYQVVNCEMASLGPDGKEKIGISLDLIDKNGRTFRAKIYDGKAWKSVCDSIFDELTTAVDMWSAIPDYYKVTKDSKKYVIASIGGYQDGWYFELTNLFVVHVALGFNMRPEIEADSEQIAEIIREICDLVRGKSEPAPSK